MPVSSVNPSFLRLQLSSKQSSNPSSHPRKAFLGATTNKLFTFVFLLFLKIKWVAKVTAVFPEPWTEKLAPLVNFNNVFKSLFWNFVNFIFEKPNFVKFSISLSLIFILNSSEDSFFWLEIVSWILFSASFEQMISKLFKSLKSLKSFKMLKKATHSATIKSFFSSINSESWNCLIVYSV